MPTHSHERLCNNNITTDQSPTFSLSTAHSQCIHTYIRVLFLCFLFNPHARAILKVGHSHFRSRTAVRFNGHRFSWPVVYYHYGKRETQNDLLDDQMDCKTNHWKYRRIVHTCIRVRATSTCGVCVRL
jgi:hypothetical protein